MSGTPLPSPPGLPPAPLLTEVVIGEELNRVFAREHRSSLVAIFGTGAPGNVLAQARRFEIVPTRSELDMRAHLPETAERDARDGRVFLVDWAEKLPQDIACRLAGGRLWRISRDNHLAAIFGARSADPRLVGTALAGVLLADLELGQRIKKISGQVLQHGDAYARFVNALADFSLEPDYPLVAFLSWCVRNEKGGAVADRMRGDAGARLGEELAGFIGGRYGALGRAGWVAWLAGQGSLFWQYALLVHALSGQWGQGTYFEGALEERLNALPFGALLLAAREELTDGIVKGVLAELKWMEHDRRRAEQLLDRPKLRDALAPSRILPRGLDARREALAGALRAVAESPTPERLTAARRAREAVLEHDLAEPGTIAEDMGLRLAAFLVEDARPQPAAPATAAYQCAMDLAEWYARDGGFVDWARRVLRPIREGPYQEAIQLLLARVDERRLEKDRVFAEGLVAWLQHDQPSAQVVPIADASRKLLADFLQGHEGRKCLVVMMDGMSHADAATLVASLEQEGDKWLPASWRPKGYALPAGLLPPVIAAAPSLTQVSRAAFFAGRWSRADAERPTSEDRKRWKQNKHLAPFFDAEATPELLLKDEVLDAGGLSKQAIKSIAGPARVVAVVVNAMDDQLKAGPQISIQYEAGHIPPLHSLLEYAAHAERAVLLVSDHGHVTGDRLESKGTAREDGGARWRPLAPGEGPAPFEVVLSGKNVGLPKGVERVAAIWDERATYGTPGYGAHGGVSLAEMSCPAVLLVPQSLEYVRAGAPDEALRGVGRYEPSWWRFEGVGLVAPAPAEVKAPVAPPSQADMFELPAPAVPSRPPSTSTQASPARHELAEKLSRSPVFKVQAEGKPAEKVSAALAQVSLLLEAGDRMSLDEFARRLGLPPFRASGPILELQSLLNVEGYAVVELDRTGRQVRVNRPMLVQTFELGGGS